MVNWVRLLLPVALADVHACAPLLDPHSQAPRLPAANLQNDLALKGSPKTQLQKPNPNQTQTKPKPTGYRPIVKQHCYSCCPGSSRPSCGQRAPGGLAVRVTSQTSHSQSLRVSPSLSASLRVSSLCSWMTRGGLGRLLDDLDDCDRVVPVLSTLECLLTSRLGFQGLQRGITIAVQMANRVAYLQLCVSHVDVAAAQAVVLVFFWSGMGHR